MEDLNPEDSCLEQHQAELVALASELASEHLDYTEIAGIHSLRTVMEGSTDKRLSWMTRKNEVIKAFDSYGLEYPTRGNPGEITMLRMIRSLLIPEPCPSCMDKVYDDTRWHKVTDEGKPIRIATTRSFDSIFGGQFERALQFWVDHTDKLMFEIVDERDNPDALCDRGVIDGRRGTLGYVSRIREGDIGQAQVYMLMDQEEQWSSFMAFAVLVHEIGHIIGLGHTPKLRKHLREVMFPVYYRIIRDISGWTQTQLEGKYGAPDKIVT